MWWFKLHIKILLLEKLAIYTQVIIRLVHCLMIWKITIHLSSENAWIQNSTLVHKKKAWWQSYKTGVHTIKKEIKAFLIPTMKVEKRIRTIHRKVIHGSRTFVVEEHYSKESRYIWLYTLFLSRLIKVKWKKILINVQ